MRLRNPLTLLLSLGLVLAPPLPAATEAPTPEAPASESPAADGPSAPGDTVFRRGRRGRRPGRRPGTRPTPPVNPPPSSRRPGNANQALDRWIAQELRSADGMLARGQTLQARDRLYQVGLHLRSRPEFRYQRISQAIGRSIQEIDYRRIGRARSILRDILQRLGNGGGQDPIFQRVLRDLRQAVWYLDQGRTGAARRYTLAAYNRMYRSSDWRLRQEVTAVRQADLLVAQNRPWEAASILRGVLARLGNGGGGGQDPNRCRRDRPNRMEWRRDIWDLIDTIGDGNMRMAQRDLRTLIRDVRQDGYVWECNKGYVQRLQFIGQRLTWGNEDWCIQKLRALRQDLNF